MSTRQLVGVLLIAGAAYSVFFVKDNPSGPAPDVPSIEAPAELVEALAGTPEPQLWAGMLSGLGRFIEQDGKTQEPLLSSVDHLADLVSAATRAPVRAIPGGPQVGSVLGPRLKQLGGPGEDLTPESRARAVELFKQAAGALRGGNG